jgi:ubiquinone/menaquinone biosynthesis C-methylase UbiE
MGLEKQGEKPTGLLGFIIGRLMNVFHTNFYIDYFGKNLPIDNSKILDIGCGGGKFIKYLADANPTYLLNGLDHSPEMIALSKKTNKNAIGQKRVKILQGSADAILLDNSMFDLVTALETVQFWPDIEKSFAEVYRLLKNEGKFLIINRYPDEGTKWWKMAKIKNDKEFVAKLQHAGFNQISVDLDFKKGWIIVIALK